MDQGIQIFSSKGTLLPLDLIEPQLKDDAMRERFSAVRRTYEALQAADADVKACGEAITTGIAEVRDAENFLREHFPAPTFHDLWRQMKATRASE